MRREIKTKKRMQKVISDKACWVVAQGGQHIIYSPSGEELGMLTITSVKDRVGELPRCTAEFVVNIADSYEQMAAHVMAQAERDKVF